MIAILAALPLALATDLETRLTTPDGAVKSLTFHDVERSAPPPFTVQMNGADVRVTLAVAPADGAWVVSAELAQVDKKGRVKVLSAPRVTLQADEPGIVKQGARIPIPGTNPLEYREESWQLDMKVRPS